MNNEKTKQEAKHTPGPWYFTEGEYGVGRVRVQGGSVDYTIRADMADARLIAAAPELAEALQAERAKVALLSQYGEEKWGDEWWPGLDDKEGVLEVDTKAALKKAGVA